MYPLHEFELNQNIETTSISRVASLELTFLGQCKIQLDKD